MELTRKKDSRKSADKLKAAVDKSSGSDIIKAKNVETAVSDVNFVGKIDREIYKCVTEDIVTDEVIITDERIAHIKEHHPGDYEAYFKYAGEILKHPDYILEANKPNTAFILKRVIENGQDYQMILRLKTSNEPIDYKNSILTFLKIDEKRFRRYLRTKKVLYKSE